MQELQKPTFTLQRSGQSVPGRLHHLEDQNVSWEWESLASVIFLGAHAQSEPPAKTVEAQEFILKDSSGRMRARLGMKNDQANIEFYDEQGATVWTVPNKGFKPILVH